MSLERQTQFSWSILLLLFMLAAFVLISYLVFPLLDSMILGIVFAYVGRPVRDLFGHRRLLGSLFATCCIAIPISVIVGIGALEIINQILWMAENQEKLLGAALLLIKQVQIPRFVIEELMASINNIFSFAASIASSLPVFGIGLGMAFSMHVLNFIISLPTCYFLLADGWKVERAILALLPQEKLDIAKRYLTRIDWILSGIFLGSIYTAIAGGLVSIVIFYLFGVPRPFALASMVFLAGLIPFMTWLVFIPTSIYRYFLLGPLDALVFFAVGSIIVHLAELIIRPYFVSTKSSLHPLLVMITFIGGGLVAGIAGFFLAPALAGIIVAIYQINLEQSMVSKKESNEISA